MTPTTKVARAFAPAHITGLFAIFPGGSTGAGLNLSDGAVTTVTISPAEEGKPSVSVTINGTPSEAPVSRQVLRSFDWKISDKCVLIKHETAFPVGYGLGMSGAGVFSLSLALNEALGRGLTYKDCQRIAFDAEIACGTGLGTVTSQEFYGLMMGEKPYPSTTVKMLPAPHTAVVCAFFNPIETASIIRDPEWKGKITALGLECMEELEADFREETLVSLSRRFTESTGLAGGKVKEAMRLVPEASMAMLGQTAFALTRDPERVVAAFRNLSEHVTCSSVATQGATLL